MNNMNAYWKTITPEIAHEWLRGNTINRPVKQHYVRMLASDMELGRWKRNGETIKRNGRLLLDGQHRLLACIMANTPFETLVVDGIDRDVFPTIDDGCPRSRIDTLAVAGEKITRY